MYFKPLKGNSTKQHKMQTVDSDGDICDISFLDNSSRDINTFTSAVGALEEFNSHQHLKF